MSPYLFTSGLQGRSPWSIILAAALLLVSAFAPPALAGQRVALVIGNASYAHAASLANPLNDATDVGTALDRLGFAVTRLDNANYSDLRQGLQQFSLAASASEMAVVFYAGHGIEVDKRNFLIPVDARLLSDADVEFETVPLDLLSRAVDRVKGLRLIILDACRDNPFAVAMQRSGATRSIGRGLASVEPSGETLVAYAAKEGTVAADGEGRNSPYTRALLAHLEEPGLEVGLMFRKVRDAVLAETGGRQEPFVYGSLSSAGAYLAARPDPAPSPSGETEDIANSDEQLFWESVKGSRNPADFRAYLKQFPDGVFAALARNRIEHLSNPQVQPTDDPEALEAALGLQRSERQRIQTALWASGFDPAGRDGLFDRKTRSAIGRWQTSHGMPATGYLDVEAARTLLGMASDLSGGIWAMAEDKPCQLWNPTPQPGETVKWSGGCQHDKATGRGRAVWSTAHGQEVYEGWYREGRKHGRGTAVWPDGRRYEGEWRRGKEHGKGAAIASDGTRYEGVWHEGRMPQRGVIVWPNGNRYEGEWRDGEPHGEGRQTWSGGGSYEGEWQAGKEHGQGIGIFGNGDRYEGEFREGKIHGRGIETFADGGRYEGSYRNGKRHGRGILTSPDGHRYEGEFRIGERHGRGTFTWPNGDRYEGEFREGKIHGRGIETFADGGRYEGSYRNGKRHGRGIRIWPDGHRYEGEFRIGERHGRGTFTWPNGDRYEGEFREGKIHGRGIETFADGGRYEGSYRNGKRHGRGIRIWPDGTRYEGGFQNGQIHGQGVVRFSHGRRYDGKWREEKIHGWGIYFDKTGDMLAQGPATDGCWRHDGYWVTWGKSAEACGFE